MVDVNFHSKDVIEDKDIIFTVIAARYQGTWVMCKHKKRISFEIPGGHREIGESLDACARRELYEETGAISFLLKQIQVYSVQGKTRVAESKADAPTYGMLYYADIKELGNLPDSEMEEIKLFENISEVPSWTYEFIQPLLFNKVIMYLEENKIC